MNLIKTKMSVGKPEFKDLVGLKKIKINDSVTLLAESLHKGATFILSEDGYVLNVCTERGFYTFQNFGEKYILRIGSPSGQQKKRWYKIQ